MYESTHVCKCVWRLKIGLRYLPQLLPASFIETESLTWAQSPSDSVNSASQVVPRKLSPPSEQWDQWWSTTPIRHLYGCRGPELWSSGMHTECWAISQPKICLRVSPTKYVWEACLSPKRQFSDSTNPGTPVVKVRLYLTTPSCTVFSLSLFNCVSMTSQHYKLASCKTEGYPMSYTGQDLLGKGPGVVWEHYKQ